MRAKKLCTLLLAAVLLVIVPGFSAAAASTHPTVEVPQQQVKAPEPPVPAPPLPNPPAPEPPIELTPIPNEMANAIKLRRPVSNEQPMWIVHIDSWNYADPQKIIDLIPKDILPFVVFNISLSINFDTTTKEWKMVEYGYETAKSWLRTCADNNVWAMIQPSSGGQSHFPDYDDSTDYENTVFAEFYRDYPNFLGFNYCEQFWGFELANFPITPVERYEHFARLLKLSNKYGGFLVVSWCGNQYSQSINPIAMLKRVPKFEEASRTYAQNYILLEKYTTRSYKNDMESLVLGAYLSGYSGQYGIRYDESGWRNDNDENKDYTLATGLSAHLERYLLSGMTVIDGPELIWADDFKELSAGVTEDGYSTRRWSMYPQFQNVMIDMFRKVLDGTIRIPTRDEVIKRTKAVIIHDVDSGDNDAKYSSPTTLSEGLYRMDGDGNLQNNISFFKKTGRYPAIPTVYQLKDPLAKSFEVQVKKSDYASRWPDIASKVTEFNNLFASEYTGDIFAGRNENRWIVYNPYKANQTASGSIPFQYNTAQSIDLTLSHYSSGILNEYRDSVSLYLNNYDNKLDQGLKTDVIRINGSTKEPGYTYTDRGVNQLASQVTSQWENGVFTLTVQHNGPVDIQIKAKGTAAGRKVHYKKAKIVAPKNPPVYKGARQYEAEFFDYKNIAQNLTQGAQKGILNYTGQGYMKVGSDAAASVRDAVYTDKAGSFTLKLKYTVTEGDINTLDLLVNGQKVSSPLLTKTADLSSWAIYEQPIQLSKGKNTIEFTANAALAGTLYFDNFTVEGDFGGRRP